MRLCRDPSFPPQLCTQWRLPSYPPPPDPLLDQRLMSLWPHQPHRQGILTTPLSQARAPLHLSKDPTRGSWVTLAPRATTVPVLKVPKLPSLVALVSLVEGVWDFLQQEGGRTWRLGRSQ